MRLDKRNARRRLHNKRKQYEKEIDLQASDSIGREKQKQDGNRSLRPGRTELLDFDLAIRRATERVAAGQDRDGRRTAGGSANGLVD